MPCWSKSAPVFQIHKEKDKLIVLTGGYSSDVTFAMAAVAQYRKAPFLITTGADDEITELGIAMIEKFCGVKIAFFHWMGFALPLLLFLFVLLYFLMYFLHKPEVARIEGGTEFVSEQRARLGKWTRGQKMR